MKLRVPLARLRGPLAGCLALILSLAQLHAKPIRLRNEVIVPPPPASAAALPGAALVAEPPVSGLFLVQFTDVPQAEWRQQLSALGVELLRYVPEDTFIARFQRARPGVVRALSFVTWVGPYRPELKLHRGVIDALQSPPMGGPVEVSVLLAPGASANEVFQARQSLRPVRQESRLRSGTIVRGQISTARLAALAQSDAVLWIERAPRMKLVDEVASKIVAGDGGPHHTLTQSLGFDGTGVSVAVADSGLDSGVITNMHPDIAARVAALFAYGGLPDASDEHSHGTHVAGIVAGNGATGETDDNNALYGLGVAPGANLIAQRIFDGAGNYFPPPSFETLTRDATRAGAAIGSNSWGDDTQGRYDLSAEEFDGLVRDADFLKLGDQPYILEFSAGNAGPGTQTVGSPAVAKNVIATGACNSDRRDLPYAEFAIYDTGPDTMADFSSRGPCEDGRIKPDVVAPGTWIASLRSVFANDDNAWWPISGRYMYQGGTSQAGPHVSGAAAVFVQYWRATHANATPSPALVKAALINSAADMDNAVETAPVPNMDEGWGRVDLPALVAPTRNYDFVDQSVLLTNGQVFERRVVVADSYAPLKITLAYTDVPGLPAAVPALVNDLDLEVIAPDGHVYHGNQFENGESVPDLPGFDSINNVEAVHLAAPVPGEYVIRVRGSHIVMDARSDTVGVVDQDFALVTSASIAASGLGVITLDRPAYRAPDVIKLRLVDYDLAGQSNAVVQLRSDTETNAETITLRASGVTGLFTGSVVTVTGPAVPDGQLQINHGDIVEATYQDAHPPGVRTVHARADLRPPVIANVTVTNLFGQIIISWDTDEIAAGIVRYGTNALDHAVTNHVLDVSQEIQLTDPQPGQTYKFAVVAEDEAGNRATNNNGGAYFTFTRSQLTRVLLVDSFADFLGGLVALPPLSGYTDALDRLGVTYDVFDATAGAEPTLAQLQSYRCVIWRVSDLDVPSTTLAQHVVSYVNGGGSLLLASMEALSRFPDTALGSFVTNTLQVTGFTVDQPVSEVHGVSSDPLGNGIASDLDYTPYDDILMLAGTTDPSDWITAWTTNAAPFLEAGSATVGLRAPKPGRDMPGRVVFLSFPLDTVPLGTGVGNNRAGLLQNMLNFLAPTEGTGTIALDSGVYTVPARAVIEVEDPDLAGQDQTTVRVFSPHDTNGVTVTLLKTTRDGLFRGAVSLAPTNTPVAGAVAVRDGDTLEADYVTARSGQTLSASAQIETTPPVISVVASDPGYLEAVVSWDTDKAADALVQFSPTADSFNRTNSFPNNFTAYNPAMETAHAVLLQGLQPNQKYYFRVTSRDRAGNAAADDNLGALYSFTTLQPATPPWSDNMETPNPGWSTYTVPDSETEWTVGAPGGGETAASPPNCWGSNLGGGPIGQAECYLISPGLLLTGGNRATLRFKHNYDFTSKGELDIAELGAVEILTNITDQPTPIQQFLDTSAGWEDAEVDLTPYLGKVVYVLWYYALLSFDTVPRLGWLVDDVSVTVDTVAPGTIQITNNLWQAYLQLSGPTNLTAHGRWIVLTNAPPGSYKVEYGDVPYYVTPPSQTNVLVSSNLVTFIGNYTFPDANANGISDLWELEKFGFVDPNRTRFTDSDRDGMTDYAEFFAGTDPNNPPPPFRIRALRLTNGLVQLDWPSFAGLTYRVHGSTDGLVWTPLSGWLPAAGTNTTFLPPAATNSAADLFRVEAVGGTGAGALPANLRLTAQRQTNGAVRLEWLSSQGRAYRVLSSADAANWSPVSTWLLSTGGAMTFTLTPPANGTPGFLRLEVQP